MAMASLASLLRKTIQRYFAGEITQKMYAVRLLVSRRVNLEQWRIRVFASFLFNNLTIDHRTHAIASSPQNGRRHLAPGGP
jgi:hypothetical protein